jgi:hypothetical protein
MSATWRSIVERLRSAPEHSGPATVAEIVDELAAEFRRRYPDAPPGAAIGAAHALIGRAILAALEADLPESVDDPPSRFH